MNQKILITHDASWSKRQAGLVGGSNIHSSPFSHEGVVLHQVGFAVSGLRGGERAEAFTLERAAKYWTIVL